MGIKACHGVESFHASMTQRRGYLTFELCLRLFSFLPLLMDIEAVTVGDYLSVGPQ